VIGPPLEEVSIGDYVLSGGEIAALALIDRLRRLCPADGEMASGPTKLFRWLLDTAI